ncbi:DUF5696 domain-containing protein [Paenibacillus cymbidii]|uniref:DUF5696 domain-containing protein n=1 Tax=Paenibacillus cymbidii TaxID=1639034 RepID=UPI00108008A4|nr:DUF5696 domain-containing protein [Paenibacillus cymbidii]
MTAWLRIGKRFGFPLLLACLAAYAWAHLQFGEPSAQSVPASLKTPGAVKVAKGLGELPQPGQFVRAASTGSLELSVDPSTGHFQVHDLRNGNMYRSYPDPEHWPSETQEGTWRTHLRSPLMLRYIDLSGSKSLAQPKDTNFLEEQGTIRDYKLLPGGFSLTFDLPSKMISIPVQVTLENDSVVVRIVDAGIREGALRLLSIRVYPMFGAVHSAGQEGFLFIPDGSGATIPFRERQANASLIYQEPIFGMDEAFRSPIFEPSRNRVSMPVFGMRSGGRSFLSIVEDGAAYTEIVASPSGVFSGYNWIAPVQMYRKPYSLLTSRTKQTFAEVYDKNNRFGGDRVVRYVPLADGRSDYVGMAERYRSYLVERYRLKPINSRSGELPLTLSLLGGEQEDGNFGSRYLLGTTADDAKTIVRQLYDRGVHEMTVRYMGWQPGGYSAAGRFDAVDSRIGGNAGMKSLVSFAHSLHVPVFLDAPYGVNRTGADGFSRKRDGMRNPGGTIMDDWVSLPFLQKTIDRHIAFFRSLGIDGLAVRSLGETLSSNYNTNYPGSRLETQLQQEQLLRELAAASLQLRGTRSNLYALPYLQAIDRLPDDYSYDTFSDTGGVPFLQIALHGFIAYTSDFGNDRQEYRKQLLRNLEYGANPSFVFASDNTDNLLFAEGIHPYNPNYRDWLDLAATEYRLMNEALGDVQSEPIIGHRALAPEVKETVYAGGKRIVVNYGTEPYRYGETVVPPMDYRIIRGGDNR